MKKTLSLALLLSIVVACGGSNPEPSTPAAPAAPSAATAAPAEPAPTPPPAATTTPPGPSAGAAPAKGGDPLEVGPNIYRKAFDNEQVRVMEVTFKPGDKIALHQHPDHFVYVVTPGKLRISGADGKAQDLDLKAGQAMFLPAQSHSAENPGTTETKLVVVELRTAGGAPAPKGEEPSKVGPKIYKQVFDNERVRAFEVTFAKGAKIGMHAHPDHAVYVISPGKLKISAQGGKANEMALTAGQAVFIPAEAHTAENTGATEAKLLVVELKPAAKK